MGLHQVSGDKQAEPGSRHLSGPGVVGTEELGEQLGHVGIRLPIPVSETSIWMNLPDFVAETVVVDPEAEYLQALLSRLLMTWENLSLSARIQSSKGI